MKDNTNVFVELGNATKKIVQLLCQDQEICRLLKYTQVAPLSPDLPDWDIKNENLLHSNILLIPFLREEDIKENFICVYVPLGETNENDEFSTLVFYIDVFTRVDGWLIDEDNLRPYLIMDRIKKLLNRKRLTSIGQFIFQDFELDLISHEVAKHRMTFMVDANDFN